ncbi:MAG: aspartyl protease family protein [Chloroflexota bacterium]|nr:aspartyl protease family protein [Chloroflexota bacterium]
MSEQPLRSYNAAAIAAALWDSADLEGAERYYLRALRETPADMEALHGMGRLKLAQNDLAAASIFLERALSLALQLPHTQRDELAQRIRRDLAWTLYRLDRFDLAAAHLEQLPELQALAAQLRAFEARPPYDVPPDVEEIVVPFLGTDPLPVISLTIGNTSHPFVIDTGSSQLVIDTGIFSEMELVSYGTHEATFASGQRAPVGYSILPEVMLGMVPVKDVPVEVMDVRRYAPQISGFVGINFLQRFHVLCDWREQLLRLRPRGNEPFVEWARMTAIPVWFFDTHLLLAPARLNRHETIAYLATGMAGGAFTVPQSTVEQAALDRAEEFVEGVGAAGATALESLRAERLCLGEWCREDMSGFAGFFPSELEWRYGFHVGALISHQFLKKNKLGLDFNRLRLYLE